MSTLSDLLLSCWVVEAARSSVLGQRGHQGPSVQAAARARILASRCADEGIKIVPHFASQHAQFLAEVAGADEEVGALGQIFLQRIGAYIDAHTVKVLDKAEHQQLVALGEQEYDAVNESLMAGRLLPVPPPEFPKTTRKRSAGKVLGRFAILGDPHVGLTEDNASVAGALQQMDGQGAQLAIAIGDLTANGRRELFRRARRIFEEASVEVAVTLGNHDLWAFEEGRILGVERFEEAFDTRPYSIHHVGSVRVIVLNSADPTRSPFPPFNMMAGEFTDDPPQSVPGGTFSQEMIDWMRDIGPEGPTFIALHHPPFPFMGLPPLIFGLDQASTAHLAELAVRTDAQAIFCGHSHRCRLNELEGVPVVEVASSQEWPFGYSMVEVTERGWSFNLLEIDHDPGLDPSDQRDYLFRR
ncbi:MAG: metallophosphoesterase, partial [Actinomycetota bacterium]